MDCSIALINPLRQKGGCNSLEQLSEFVAYSAPHHAELFANRRAEAESGTTRRNRIGKRHIVVIDIDEQILGPNYPVVRPRVFDTTAYSETSAAVRFYLKVGKLHTLCV